LYVKNGHRDNCLSPNFLYVYVDRDNSPELGRACRFAMLHTDTEMYKEFTRVQRRYFI